MKLLIISAMDHHLRDGTIVGWGATVRELDHLASRFETVRHIACLHEGEAPASALPYTAKNIELVPVRPSGADGLLGKLDALRASPSYVRTILRELRDADFVHVRAPANVALVGMLVVSAHRRPRGRWFKYAGNWKPDGPESLAYSLQRWWLRHAWHRGIVTVNGRWPDQQPWVRTFYNPSLDHATTAEGIAAAAAKTLDGRINLMYVGRVETPKGAGRAIEIVERLAGRGIDVHLNIIGDGSERPAFEAKVRTAQLEDRVRFVGWKSHRELVGFYRDAHFLLLPTNASEGWPKVLSEGMAFGALPIAGAVSSIPQYLAELELGAAILATDLEAYVTAIEAYVREPLRWKAESGRAVEAGHWFTFDHYLTCVDEILDETSDRLE